MVGYEEMADALSEQISEETINDAVNDFEDRVHEILAKYLSNAESESEYVLIQSIDAEIAKLN